jgi:ketosteroid isomerase-like protein
MTTDPAAVAGRFNECVNSRDLAGLAALMAEQHRFVDASGAMVSGKQACLSAWRGFFAAFPDYRNVFTSITTRGDTVVIVGHSECTVAELSGAALWTATVDGELVAEWRVHEDTPENRVVLGLSPQ